MRAPFNPEGGDGVVASIPDPLRGLFWVRIKPSGGSRRPGERGKEQRNSFAEQHYAIDGLVCDEAITRRK